MSNQVQYTLVPSADPAQYVVGDPSSGGYNPAGYNPSGSQGYGYADPNMMGQPPPIDPVEWNCEVAAGKAMAYLSKTAKGTCNIEGGSVYGVALAMPQFARTSGYSLRYTGLVLRAYFFLLCNVLLQGFLLYMISKSERVLSKYGGQMHLCDFGKAMDNCPDAPNCIGPGGTSYTAARLYNWELFSTRVYVRDAFAALFPDRLDEIGEKVDPGEYGLESYNLRAICCLLFVIGCWGDLQSSLSMWQLLKSVPNYGEPWITYEVPKWDTKEHAKAIHGWTELNLVKFKVAGMPVKWKFVNLFFVFLPKIFLWLVTLDAGVVFLLETAAIEDMIINAVALAFILAIDELICGALVSPVSLYMTTNTQAFEFVCVADEEDDSEQDAYNKHQVDKIWNICSLELWCYMIPMRLFQIMGVTGFFIGKYYLEHCQQTSDGSWVSLDVHLPTSGGLDFFTFLSGPIPGINKVSTLDEPVWTMPGIKP